MKYLESQDENPDFLNSYLKYTHIISQCSYTTVDEAYYDLRTFFRYLVLVNNKVIDKDFSIESFKSISIKDVSIDDMKEIKTQNITKFVQFCRNVLGNSSKTTNRKLASVKGLFKYLVKNNYMNVDPSTNVDFGKVEKRNPKYLSLEESKRMLAITLQSNDRNNIRNYTIVCVLLNCMLRVSEIVGINIDDIDFEDKTLKVTGKGDKDRIVYINEATEEAIKEYLKIRPDLSKNDPSYRALFLSTQMKRIAKRTVQHIVDESMSKTLEETRGYHTHTLRHTGATLMYNENDTDIFVLQKILGHDSLVATEVYTHVSNKKLEKIMTNFAISSLIEKEVANNE